MYRHHNISTAESEVEVAKRKYLEAYGWKLTCMTPGSLWLWERQFTFQETRQDPEKYAVPTDVAIRMTRAVLDFNED